MHDRLLWKETHHDKDMVLASEPFLATWYCQECGAAILVSTPYSVGRHGGACGGKVKPDAPAR